MFGFFKKLHKNEKGNYFVEIALAMIIIVFVIASSMSAMVQQGIVPKYKEITEEIERINVPDINPQPGETQPN